MMHFYLLGLSPAKKKKKKKKVKQSKYNSMAKAAGAHFVAAVWGSGALGQGAR